MTLTRFFRTIDRLLWRWRKPKADAVVIDLQCKRIELALRHKPRRHIDKQLRAHKHDQLRKELAQ